MLGLRFSAIMLVRALLLRNLKGLAGRWLGVGVGFGMGFGFEMGFGFGMGFGFEMGFWFTTFWP
jgi:hypothetical protein